MPLDEPPIHPRRILARKLFDGLGDTCRTDQLIEIEAGRIARVGAWQAGGAGHSDMVEADIVSAGFIDLQINGANDVQFNFDPTPEALERIAQGARRGGTAHLLPTFITAPDRQYLAAIDAARAAIDVGVPGILGLHLEGPFLSPERPGIHDPAAIRALDPTDLSHLGAAFPGVLLLTLAPEHLPPGTLTALSDAGVIVFAGHSAATAACIEVAQTQGLRGATHLFNAMSQLTGREPGLVGVVLASDRLFAGIVADGHHVAWSNIGIAARLMPDRLCLVTDAMLTLAGRTTEFDLHGEAIRLEGGRLTNAADRLAGAHVAMDESVRNLVAQLDMPIAAALRMASANPARALGLGDELGVVRAGYRASLTLLDNDLEAVGTVVDGALFDRTG
ncbi:N-acetylglucosamine-6-phosphate deacetylase [Maliponia aquimaris]|uniref:N-acetylglucosamine-6-phosphate deacetylase n=1 Tax=Maliponia aquimaris TaxID=1673631 RepID=A0A238L1K6_9RHOB|nr:N-acetylglucosamine-6-phosphate deacetylase [Maliponia aquimaris]